MDLTLREAVLRYFTQSNAYVSGERLSEALGCTRTAVWKQIEELRALGYVFDAKPRKGYRLVSRPDVVLAEEIKCFNEAAHIGQEVRYVDTTPSTQQIAHKWAREGAAHGALVVADEQTAGKGRMGRFWHSPPGSGIWMSFILRPAIPLVYTPHLTILVAVAVTRALRRAASVDALIKWPNDLFIAGRKVCGVLTEVRAEADRIHYVVAGVGINVHTTKEDWPPELRPIATSLTQEIAEAEGQSITGGAVEGGDYGEEKPHLSRARIIAACCEELEQLLNMYEKNGFSPIRSLWESYAFMLGQTVTVRASDGTKRGKALGLDESGALLLQTSQGVEPIFSADVLV